MQPCYIIKKGFTVSIILLFISVAVAPSINSTVVKASDDLVEVTSQACGIQKFRNTTVKLTKQQYQDLKQYFVDFGAHLNQTTGMKEAAPLFKEAVVELNKYGILPHGMSVRQAQRLITPYKMTAALAQKTSSVVNPKQYTNLFCLIAGKATYCTAANLLMNGVRSFVYNRLVHGYLGVFGELFVLSVWLLVLLSIRNFVCPLDIFSLLTFGGLDLFWYPFPAVGWISTVGLQGTKNQTGPLYGQIPLPVRVIIGTLDIGAFGFTGFKIICPDHEDLFVGTALLVNIGDTPPENATK